MNTIRQQAWLDEDDLAPREERFAYKGNRYLLTEPSAAAISAWRNVILEGSAVGPDGRPTGIKIRPDSDSLLVSKCLYMICVEIDDAPNAQVLRPVTQEFVESLHFRLQSKLISKVREMGGMNPTPDTLKDCDDQIGECEKRLEELRAKRALLNGEAPEHSKNGRTATAGSSA